MSKSCGGAVYGVGFVGALVYYMQQVGSLLDVFTGLFKAIFWPAFLVYQALGFLG